MRGPDISAMFRHMAERSIKPVARVAEPVTEVEALARELEAVKRELDEWREQADEEKTSWKTWFAAASTASVTLLAFLIPSVQEQWDRLHRQQAVEEYRAVARDLQKAAKYHEAADVLGRALELSEEPRLDVELEQLVAKTAQVNSDPNWRGKIDPDLSEGDFALLEAMEARAKDGAAQAWALNNHAVFVANQGDPKRALELAQRAAALAPTDARIQVTLGNLHWDLGKLELATRAYEAALSRDPNNVAAHYNLARLCEDRGDLQRAGTEFERVISLRPEDTARGDLERVRAQVAERS
jgi:tetratricopeptide (TPR) repeat protein